MSTSSLPQELRLLNQSETSESNVDLILIPGIGTPPVEDWAIASDSWKKFLNATKPPPRLVAFDSTISLNGDFTVKNILDQGKVLLKCLVDLQAGTEFSPTSPVGLRRADASTSQMRRLAFMCHSLGGFILKQALCIAHAQSQKHGSLLGSILGIVFLGVPHMVSDPQALPERLLLILKSVQSKISRQTFVRISEELRVLVEISKLFQDIELRVELASVYELIQTKVKGLKEGKGIFKSSPKLILVGKKDVITGAPQEREFSLAANHADLIKLQQENGDPDELLSEWMRSLFSSNSHDAVDRRLKSLKIRMSPTASQTSMSSYDAARLALSSEPVVSSHDASRSDEPRSDDPTAGSSTIQSWELVSSATALSTVRRLAQLPCFMIELYEQNKDFFGREEELQELDRYLLPPDDMTFSGQIESRRHVVLCGMGGLGKTSLAIEFAHSRRAKFDAVFWIRADEVSKMETDFCQIASRLGLEDPSEPRDPVVSRDLAKGWLSNPRRVLSQEGDIVGQAEASWLLIFDNADKPDILQDCWPISSNGSILVTSRDPLSRSSPSAAQHYVELEPFTSKEAATFLRRLSHNDREEEISFQVAEKLGGLPLAISQMAAIIRYQYLSYSDFLERYEDDPDREKLLGFEAGATRQEARGNLASIFAVELLETPAKSILQVCSMLDSDCIQERIFLEGASDVCLLNDFPTTMFSYSLARADLLRSSLLKRNEKREFWVHRMVQDAVRTKMSKERTRSTFLTCVSLVCAAWGTTSLVRRHDMTLSKSREGLFPHALSLKSIYQKLYKDSDPKCGVQFASLLNEAGWWQHERGNSQDIKPFLNLALQICEQNADEDMSQILSDIHYGLAAVANETNDGQACLRHTNALLDMRLKAYESSGIADVRLAIAHNEIAIAWVMNGMYDQAISAFKSSIDVYRGLEDYWPAMDTNPRTNIGFTYWVMGELDIAYTELEGLLRDREAKFGFNDSESYRTGRVLHGLGNVRFSQGRIKESEDFHNRALAHYLKTYGNNHHKTADLCHRVAQHCMRNNDLETAAKLINQALKVYRLRRSIYTPELARTTFLKAKLLMCTGEEEMAASLFKDAKTLRSCIPGASEKADASLRETDFDGLVTFFSR